MSGLSDFVFANSNQSYFGNASPFGDPRDAYINGINKTMNKAASTGQGQTWQSSNTLVGGFGNDYITAYNWTSNEVDILVGGKGSDTFVAGDRYGVHYLNAAVAIVADYNFYEGDVVQLSSRGSGGYTYRQGNFGLGSSALDTTIYYNNDAIMVLSDTTKFNWRMI
jgi:serralysin